MNFLHLYSKYYIFDENVVPGGAERTAWAWIQMLDKDPKNKHYLYSLSNLENTATKRFENHILSNIKIKTKISSSDIQKDLTKICLEKDIDVIINHTFTSTVFTKATEKLFLNKKIHILNILYSNVEFLIYMAPFKVDKLYYTNKLTYSSEDTKNKNKVFVAITDYAGYGFKYGEPKLRIEPLGLDYYVFPEFLNFFDESNLPEIQESDGSIVLIGRASYEKRLVQTVNYLKSGPNLIKVFCSDPYPETNGIISALKKIESQNSNVIVFVNAPRNILFENLRKAKCFVSPVPYETGPITALEACYHGVPVILSNNSKFGEKYGLQEILKDTPHWIINTEILSTSKNHLLDVVSQIPEDIETRKYIQTQMTNRCGKSKFKDGFYRMIEHVTAPENEHKYSLSLIETPKTNYLF